MSRTLKISNVPDVLHRELAARAGLEGLSLSAYLLREIQKLASRPALRELRARLESRESVNVDISPAHAIRRQRGR